MDGLTIHPVSRKTIREWDRRATEEFGIPGIVLMENAARGCADVLSEILAADPGGFGPPYKIICGPGNNGGDGLALARHLHNRRLPSTLYLVEPREKIRPDSDAGANLGIAERMGLDIRLPCGRVSLREILEEALGEGTVIDAMFGTGLDRPLRPPFLDWVEAIGRSGRPVLAIDIPTGLDADTGQVLGASIRASHTITMAAPKTGFALGAGPIHVGEVHVVDIGIPRELLEEVADGR